MLDSFDSLQSMGAQEVADIGLSPRFRLKNLATSPHVTQLLLDATGPLAELHRRMLEAGCEVDPEWKLGEECRPSGFSDAKFSTQSICIGRR